MTVVWALLCLCVVSVMMLCGVLLHLRMSA